MKTNKTDYYSHKGHIGRSQVYSWITQYPDNGEVNSNSSLRLLNQNLNQNQLQNKIIRILLTQNV